MKLSEAVKPISYVKSHAAEIIEKLSDGGPPVVITQNGEAKAVLMGVGEYERTQDSLTLLKILAQSSKNLEQGRARPVEEVVGDLRKKYAR